MSKAAAAPSPTPLGPTPPGPTPMGPSPPGPRDPFPLLQLPPEVLANIAQKCKGTCRESLRCTCRALRAATAPQTMVLFAEEIMTGEGRSHFNKLAGVWTTTSCLRLMPWRRLMVESDSTRLFHARVKRLLTSLAKAAPLLSPWSGIRDINTHFCPQLLQTLLSSCSLTHVKLTDKYFTNYIEKAPVGCGSEYGKEVVACLRQLRECTGLCHLLLDLTTVAGLRRATLEEMGRLTQVTHLDLRCRCEDDVYSGPGGKHMDGMGPQDVFDYVAPLTGLRELRMTVTNMGDKSKNWRLPHLPHLARLEVEVAVSHYFETRTFPPGNLSGAPSLTDLDIPLMEDTPLPLGVLRSLSALQRLDLGRRALNRAEVSGLGAALTQLTYLKVGHLSLAPTKEAIGKAAAAGKKPSVFKTAKGVKVAPAAAGGSTTADSAADSAASATAAAAAGTSNVAAAAAAAAAAPTVLFPCLQDLQVLNLEVPMPMITVAPSLTHLLVMCWRAAETRFAPLPVSPLSFMQPEAIPPAVTVPLLQGLSHLTGLQMPMIWLMREFHTDLSPDGSQGVGEPQNLLSALPALVSLTAILDLDARQAVGEMASARSARGACPPPGYRGGREDVDLSELPIMHLMPGLEPSESLRELVLWDMYWDDHSCIFHKDNLLCLLRATPNIAALRLHARNPLVSSTASLPEHALWDYIMGSRAFGDTLLQVAPLLGSEKLQHLREVEIDGWMDLTHVGVSGVTQGLFQGPPGAPAAHAAALLRACSGSDLLGGDRIDKLAMEGLSILGELPPGLLAVPGVLERVQADVCGAMGRVLLLQSSGLQSSGLQSSGLQSSGLQSSGLQSGGLQSNTPPRGLQVGLSPASPPPGDQQQTQGGQDAPPPPAAATSAAPLADPAQRGPGVLGFQGGQGPGILEDLDDPWCHLGLQGCSHHAGFRLQAHATQKGLLSPPQPSRGTLARILTNLRKLASLSETLAEDCLAALAAARSGFVEVVRGLMGVSVGSSQAADIKKGLAVLHPDPLLNTPLPGVVAFLLRLAANPGGVKCVRVREPAWDDRVGGGNSRLDMVGQASMMRVLRQMLSMAQQLQGLLHQHMKHHRRRQQEARRRSAGLSERQAEAERQMKAMILQHMEQLLRQQSNDSEAVIELLHVATAGILSACPAQDLAAAAAAKQLRKVPRQLPFTVLLHGKQDDPPLT